MRDHGEKDRLDPDKVTRPNQDEEDRSEHPLMPLQRSIGNKAVGRALGSGKFSSLLRSVPDTPAPGGPTVSDDASAEAEADRIADAAVRRGSSRPNAGPVLAPQLRDALAVVAPDLDAGGRLGRMKVDTSPSAGRQADAIGARAFTSGQTVSVAPGELTDPTAGTRLLAHEAVHAGRHQGVGGGGLVHAKLRGTRAGAESAGGGPSTTGLRKMIGWKTNWDKILDGLGAYEQMEETLLSGGSPSPKVLAQSQPKMLSLLAKVEASCLAWQSANGGAAALRDTEADHQRALAQGTSDVNEDTRSKVARRQVVAMLVPRIRVEMADLGRGDWNKTLGLSDAQLTAKGAEKGGQMNKVRELQYQTESGEFSGYFKAEKGFSSLKEVAGHDLESGIRQHDPNFGARSIAMYRLDQLLGAGVTARVEYAVHDGKLGTVMESAKGKRADEHNWTTNEQGLPGTPSADDAVLQRCLNRLQILDAIAGQLDRHIGNFFVQTDMLGKVSGVTGIDLDMSFGRDNTSIESGAMSAFNYKGMPEQIDEEFGRRVMAISDDQIRQALSGLLPLPEVEATIARFQAVKQRIDTAEKAGLLVHEHDWGADTRKGALPKPEDLSKQFKRKNYTANIVDEAAEKLAVSAVEAGELAMRAHIFDLPQPTQAAYRTTVIGDPHAQFESQRGAIYPLVRLAIGSGQLPGSKAEEAAADLIEDMMGDVTLRNKVEVAIQEMNDQEVPNWLKQAVISQWASILARYAKTPVLT